MMVSKKLAVAVLAGMVFVSAGFCGDGNTATDPIEDTSILIEAFVVRVPTEAMAELGLSPIGPAPDEVTKLIKAMAAPDGAEMAAATKVLVRHGHESRVDSRTSKHIAVKQQGMVSFPEYQNHVSFSANPRIKTEKTVSLDYAFSASLFEASEDEEAGLPIVYQYDWLSSLTAESGKPFVAVAAPSEGSVTFLILCATIQEVH